MLQRRETEPAKVLGEERWGGVLPAAWTGREADSATTSCHCSLEFLSGAARLDSGCEAHSNG